MIYLSEGPLTQSREYCEIGKAHSIKRYPGLRSSCGSSINAKVTHVTACFVTYAAAVMPGVIRNGRVQTCCTLAKFHSRKRPGYLKALIGIKAQTLVLCKKMDFIRLPLSQ